MHVLEYQIYCPYFSFTIFPSTHFPCAPLNSLSVFSVQQLENLQHCFGFLNTLNEVLNLKNVLLLLENLLL